MENSVLTQVLLPMSLALIMFGMGLSLTKNDFLRLWKIPKAVIAGLLGQLIIMPLIAYGVAVYFELSASLAIGLMILAACPGGTMSNVFSLLARANLALSVTLTAITTVVCVFSTPFIIQFSINHFGQQTNTDFSLAGTTLGLFFVTLLPVLIGIIIREKYPSAAKRKEPFFRKFSGIFIMIMIVAILIQERDILVSSFSDMFGAAISLNLLSIAAGLALAKICHLTQRDGITLGIEVGIQNASMAILIAVSFLNKPDLATSAGVYGLTMYIGASILVLMSKRIKD